MHCGASVDLLGLFASTHLTLTQIPSKSTSYIFERDLEAEEYLDITGKRKFLCEYIDPRRRRFLTRQVYVSAARTRRLLSLTPFLFRSQVFSQADMVDFVPDDDNFKKLARKRPNRRGFDGCVAEAVRLHAVLQEVLEERREQLATMKPSIDASASSALELSMPLGEQPASSRARSNRKRPTAAQRKAARGLSKPGQLRAGDLIAFYRPGPVHHTADNLLEQRILQIRKSILPVRLQSGIEYVRVPVLCFGASDTVPCVVQPTERSSSSEPGRGTSYPATVPDKQLQAQAWQGCWPR